MQNRFWREVFDWAKALIFAAVVATGLRFAVAEARDIPSESMVPTLQIGDRIMVDKLFWRFDHLDRKDVIVFMPPAPVVTRIPYVKRLIGLPGDTVEIAGGRVMVNDVALEESYIAAPPTYNFGPVRVPEGQLFVLGDNRNESFDSADWGFVSQERVIGRVFWKIWPPKRFGPLEH